MEQGSKYILTIGAGAGCIGILYFLSLVVQLPFVATLLPVLVALYLLARWLNRSTLTPAEEKPAGKLAIAVLIAGIAILTNKACYIATLYGQWDAWGIWNLHAKYMATAPYWKNMFLLTTHSHPDYPPLLPGIIAFLNKALLQTQHLLVSYGFHFLITLLIPILIYLETYRKSLLVAGLALVLFATNEFYIAQGVGQLADTLLAFYLLCAMVAMQHHKEDKRMLVLSAAFLGLCILTKNEGVVIATIFIIYHFREMLGTGRLRYTLAGIALPVACWLLYKLAYAPANDMVAGQNGGTLQKLVQPERYKLIYTFFTDNLGKYFRDAKYGVVIYLLLCAIRRRLPDKKLLMLLTILAAYMMIYVVTPRELEWHLFTSQLRLMHQLMPGVMYVLAQRFAGGSTGQFQATFVSVRQRLR